MSYSLALSGPMPGDSDYRAPTSTSSSGGGGGWAGAASSIAQTTGTLALIAAGAPQKAERDSRRQLEIARLSAAAAGGDAAARIEIARLQAEATKEAALSQTKGSEGMVKMVMIGVGGLAVLGIVAAVVLKK